MRVKLSRGLHRRFGRWRRRRYRKLGGRRSLVHRRRLLRSTVVPLTPCDASRQYSNCKDRRSEPAPWSRANINIVQNSRHGVFQSGGNREHRQEATMFWTCRQSVGIPCLYKFAMTTARLRFVDSRIDRRCFPKIEHRLGERIRSASYRAAPGVPATSTGQRLVRGPRQMQGFNARVV